MIRRVAILLVLLGATFRSHDASSDEPKGDVATTVWVKALGGKGSDEGRDVAVDGQGNILVTGYVRTDGDFGGGTRATAARGTGVFVAKYGSDGSHRWSKVFGGGRTKGFGIAADAAGNVAVTGMNGGNLAFDGRAIPQPTNLDVFVAKFGADGTHAWSHGFGGGGDDVGCAVGFDPEGNVVLAGTYLGPVTVGGTVLPDTDSIDLFVAKYAGADGRLLWVKAFGGPGPDGTTRGGHYLSLAVGPAGEIFLAGAFSESLAFGKTTLASKEESDGFVARLDPTGAPTWAVAFGGPQDDVPQAIALDVGGNVLVCGGFQATADFGGGTLESKAQNDVFVLKLSSAGAHVWSRRFGGGVAKTGPTAHMRFPTQPEHASGIGVDAQGRIVLAGMFGPAADLGTGSMEPDGRQDAFLLVLKPDGAPLVSRRLGGPGRDLPRAMALLPGGDVVLTGKMEKTWPHGATTVQSAGRDDVLLVRATP